MDNNNQVPTDSEYLGITEAADYLRVSASTLRRWEKKGFLVPERTPTGIRRYTKKQLDDVIQTPAYEKPAVSAQAPSEFNNEQEVSDYAQPPQTPVQPTYVVDPEPLDEYIHVVDPQPNDQIAQHTIDSQIEARPSSYTSLNIEHAYTPLEYGQKPQQHQEEKIPFEPVTSFNDMHEHHTAERVLPEMTATDNFATVGQQQFNHIFDIKDPDESEDQVELEEYDSDAAYIEAEPRSSSYSGISREPANKPKRNTSWIKPVFLFVSLFLAIVIISLVAWFALSSTSVSGAPLNPVID
jgi:hypothetical protein